MNLEVLTGGESMLFNFLKKNEIVKLKVLSILFEKGKMSTRELANEGALTPAAAKRAVTSLNEDLEIVTNNNCMIVSQNQMFSLHFEEGMGISILLKEIYKYYAENTVEYIVFTSILLENETNILSLCMNSNISQSYCYSKIHDLNDYMKRYDVRFEVNNFIISIVGPEANIIFLTYMVIDLLETLNIDYIRPYDPTKISENFGQEMCSSYQIPENRLSIFEHIKRTYLTRQAYVKNITFAYKDTKEILSVFVEECDLIRDRLDMDGNEDARLFYNMFIRCTVPGIDTIEIREKIARRCCEVYLDNPMVKNAVLVTKAYLDEFKEERIVPADSRYYDIIYVILLQTCYIDCLGIDFLAIFKTGIKNNIQDHIDYGFNAVEQRVAKFVSKYTYVYPNWSIEMVDSYENLLARIFNSLVFSYQQPKFNILIDSFTYFFGEISIKEQILAYYSEEMINFVSSYEEADLVISDKFTPYQEFIPHFIFYDNHSNRTWSGLIAIIASEARKKFILDTNNQRNFF